MHKIKKNDEVIILTGTDKGARGNVLAVYPKRERILISGVNVKKKHTKPNPNKNIPGGIVEKEMPIHISNVALFNPVTKKGDRVGIKVLSDGRKVRYFKSNGELVDKV